MDGIKIHLVPRAGFEPAALSLEVSCSIQLSYRGMVRDTRVELVSSVWKTDILADIRIPLVEAHATGSFYHFWQKLCLIAMATLLNFTKLCYARFCEIGKNRLTIANLQIK